MVLNSEVLPAPLGPITAVMEPGMTSSVTPVSAFTPPKARVRSRTCRTGASDRPGSGAAERGGIRVCVGPGFRYSFVEFLLTGNHLRCWTFARHRELPQQY